MATCLKRLNKLLDFDVSRETPPNLSHPTSSQSTMFHMKRLGWLDYGDARNLFSAPTHEQSLPRLRKTKLVTYSF